MSTPFLGMIATFGFNFAPRGWAMCNGQILPIAQNTALFSLLGTQYGGNGQTTFALPDLRGRVPVHMGQGPGLSNYTIGQVSGEETVTLTVNQMPAHSHSVEGASVFTSKNPSNRYPAGGGAYGDTGDTPLNPTVVGTTGGNQPHDNIQPYLTLNTCIALQGIFPSRN